MRRASVLAAVIAAALSMGLSAAGANVSSTTVPGPERAPGARSLAGGTRLGALTPAVRARIRSLAPGPASSARTLGVPVASMTVHDSTGDALFAQGDLTGAGMLQNGSGTGFGVTVKAPANPASDANWIAGGAAVAWYIDTNLNGLYEYVALMGISTVSGNLVAIVTDSTGNNLLCHATPTFVAHVGYQLAAPNGCLPHLTSARFGACMIYTTDPTDPNPPLDCAPDNQLSPVTTVQQASLSSGYWMLGADGHVYPFGGAVGYPGRVANAAAMAPRADGRGYWVVDRAGHVFTSGTAPFFGGSPALAAGEFVSTISATTNGYWLFTNRGRAFPFGNAGTYGDMLKAHLNGPIVASVATATGHGYYMVGSDGGIFCFGDARFHGSTGNLRLNKPVVGISPTSNGGGYWLVASDGGVFAFNAPFRGSMGGAHLNRAVDGLVAFGNGYLMAASDGGVFDFSNRPFLGSLASSPPSAPIIGLAAFST